MVVTLAILPQLRPPPPWGSADPLPPPLAARVDFPPLYRHNCDSWYHNAKPTPCIFGPENAPKTVVLLGDSIGTQWFSLIPAIFQAPTWRTLVHTKSSCPMVDEDFFYRRIGDVYTVCENWREAVLAELEILRPDLIVVGNASTSPIVS